MGLTAAEQKKYNERVPKDYIHLVSVRVNEEEGTEDVINQHVPAVNVDVHIEKYEFMFFNQEEKEKYLDKLVEDAREQGKNLSKAALTPKWYRKAQVYKTKSI